MSRKVDRQKAIELRKQGKTYSEIKRKLGLSKSTLSNWLNNYPLTKSQINAIEKSAKRNKELGVERCRLTKQKKRKIRLNSIYQREKSELLPLTNREIYLIGLFLYWGEGFKDIKGSLSLSNTDPRVIKFYMYWLVKCLKISKERIKVLVHLYSDMNIEESLNYWSRELDIIRSQFSRPYIKKSKRVNIDQKGFGHGTCNLVFSDVRLKEKVILGIKAISDYYAELALQP